MNTKVKDFYEDGEAYEELLDVAEENAVSYWQSNLVARLRKSWENYGVHAFLSSHDNNQLRSLAGVDADLDD